MVCEEHGKLNILWLVRNQKSFMVSTLHKNNAGVLRVSKITGGIYFQIFVLFANVRVRDLHYEILEFFQYVAETNQASSQA